MKTLKVIPAGSEIYIDDDSVFGYSTILGWTLVNDYTIYACDARRLFSRHFSGKFVSDIVLVHSASISEVYGPIDE